MCGNKYSFYDNAVKKKEILKATIVLVRIFRRVLVERNTETIRSNGKRNKNVLL
jgi:hypothetical protein